MMTSRKNRNCWSAVCAVVLLLGSGCASHRVGTMVLPAGRWLVPLKAGDTFTATNDCRVVSIEYWREILLKLNDAQ